VAPSSQAALFALMVGFFFQLLPASFERSRADAGWLIADDTPTDKAIQDAARILEKAMADTKDPAERARLKLALAAVLASRDAGTIQPEAREAIVRQLKGSYRKTLGAAGGKRAKPDPADPGTYADALDAIAAGQFGVIPLGKRVERVVDRTTAIVSIQVINFSGARTKQPQVVVTGIDTSKFADGFGEPPPYAYYITGNRMIDGTTYLVMVPFIPTSAELAEITSKK
jgi:hypothetical protein